MSTFAVSKLITSAIISAITSEVMSKDTKTNVEVPRLTEFTQRKVELHKSILKDYKALMRRKGQQAMATRAALAEKYGLSISTINGIIYKYRKMGDTTIP